MPSSFKEILGRTAKSGPPTPQRKALIAAARAAQDAFLLVSDSVVDKLLDSMFRGAESSRSGDDQRRLMTAYGVLYENRVRYSKWSEKHFEKHLLEAIQGFLDHRPTITGAPPAETMDELALVGEDAMDRFVMAARIGARIENDNADVMRQLKGRVAAVAGLDELPTGANPFRPELIATALDDAWHDVRIDPQHDNVVLERLDSHALADIGKVFAAANGALADAGYEVPKAGVKTGIYRARGDGGPTQTQPRPPDPMATVPRVSPTATSGGAGFFKQLSDMISRQLTRAIPGVVQQAMAQTQPRGGEFALGAPNDAGAAGTAASAPMLSAASIEAIGRLVPQGAYPTAATPQIVPALTHLQRAQFEQPLDFGQAVALEPMIGPDGIAQSNYMDPMSSVDVALQTPLRFVNVIRNIAQSGLVQHASQVDSTVIELVARLFDFVFEDENLPDAIKVLLSRLQIPVLKAAMLDTAFFERDDHPARRLVNTLADAGLGWEPYDGREDPLYQVIEQTVQRVLEEFFEDLSLFDRLADDVEAYVERTQAQTLAAAEPELSVKRTEAQREEGVHLATRLARRAVDERLRETPTLPFVSVFLRHTWSDFLGNVLAEHAPDAPEVDNALETADDLLWSVLPKHDVDERRRLLVKAPDLERQLRSGAHRVEMPDLDEREFFNALDDRWAGAVIGEPITIPDDFEAAIAEAEAEPAPDQAMQQVLELTAGAILEMTKDDGARVCYKVGWISEGHTRFLMTNRLNSAPLIVTPEHLAESLRQSKLRVIDRGPLVDRAINSILSALQEVRYPEQEVQH